MDNTGGKVALASIIGFVTWRSLNDSSRRHIIQLFDEFAKALAEHQKTTHSRNIPRIARSRQIEIPAIPQGNHQEPDWAAILDNFKLPAKPPGSKTEYPLADQPQAEPDARWHDVIVPPAVVLIIGKRGSGKSAHAYRLLELFRYNSSPYVVGVPSNARRLLPEWIGLVPSLEELPTKSIAIVDEAYVKFHARRSMAEENTAMSQLLNLSRQRQQTIIFVSQEARQVDRNVTSSANVVIFKDLGMMQPEFDRRELRGIAIQAKEAFMMKGRDKRPWSYVYSPDADFIGLLDIGLPSFWKPSLSRLFATDTDQAKHRIAKRMTPHERVLKAKDLRAQGASYSQIARALGVSKSTIVNYIKDYPYLRR